MFSDEWTGDQHGSIGLRSAQHHRCIRRYAWALGTSQLLQVSRALIAWVGAIHAPATQANAAPCSIMLSTGSETNGTCYNIFSDSDYCVNCLQPTPSSRWSTRKSSSGSTPCWSGWKKTITSLSRRLLLIQLRTTSSPNVTQR